MAFKPGQSGNPNGRPKHAHALAKKMRDHTDEAIEKILMRLRSDDENISLKAAQEILNRGWGKAPELIELTGEDGGPIETNAKITVEFVRANTGSV